MPHKHGAIIAPLLTQSQRSVQELLPQLATGQSPLYVFV